jgi:hypothetical protein
MKPSAYKKMCSSAAQVELPLAPPGLEAPVPQSQDSFFLLSKLMDADEQGVVSGDPLMSKESSPNRKRLSQKHLAHGLPFISNDICQQAALKAALKAASSSKRWWTLSKYPSMCPLTGFPINLLPYPPFKLCMEAGERYPHTLVDGKYLALQLISSGSLFVNGRSMEPDEVIALSQYMHRCKLGPFRPEYAVQLAKDAESPNLPQNERCRAAQELRKLRGAAEAELVKLRRIQMQRLMHLHQSIFTCEGEPTKTKQKASNKVLQSRISAQASAAYTCSGDCCASTCSGGSSDHESRSEKSFEDAAACRNGDNAFSLSYPGPRAAGGWKTEKEVHRLSL